MHLCNRALLSITRIRVLTLLQSHLCTLFPACGTLSWVHGSAARLGSDNRRRYWWCRCGSPSVCMQTWGSSLARESRQCCWLWPQAGRQQMLSGGPFHDDRPASGVSTRMQVSPRAAGADAIPSASGKGPPVILWRVAAALMYLIPWIDSLSIGREIYRAFPTSILLYFLPGGSP